ncbi:MAG: cytochrome C [Bacteroidales bacterium]|jgi:hypothetical protein|nr:cytochrome C [Bacteroidales bacterium]
MNSYLKSIVVFLLIVIGSQLSLRAQLSPGDLAEPHAHLEGLSNCTLCHELGKKVSDQLCLDCHELLNERITQNKGYHASEEVRKEACIACHSDHHGRKFKIINWDTTTFNHDLTGYELQGQHAETSCKSCHTKDFITDQNIREKEFSYLGLSTDCLNCHADYHQQSLPNDCLQCHDYKAFKPASAFDHQETQFPLLGKHTEVDCIECHPITIQNNSDYQLFKPVDHQSCIACHEDVHSGKFGNDCKKCHSENSFKQIKGLSNFDHNATQYPLTGRHQGLSCEACHKNSYTDPLPHNRCMDCHTDYHQAEFTVSNFNSDCIDCHTTAGFTPSNFGIEQHQQASFALRGAHIATPCFECHLSNDQWHFRNIGEFCVDCHQDPHKPAISPKYYPENDCKACHSEQSWQRISFDHELTGYQLEGKHASLECRECHIKPNPITNQKEHIFNQTKQDCKTCHTDPHAGQFDQEAPNANSCTTCHSAQSWDPLFFDHSKTRFVLDGAHQNLACGDCHKKTLLNNQTVTHYKIDYRCEACH